MKQGSAPAKQIDSAESRPVRVFMMDLLSVVPYYTGHLCAALKTKPDVTLEVGAITYHLDRSYFLREDLKLQPGVFDAVSRFPSGFPVLLRRVLKVFENVVNLCALLLRFRFEPPDIVHVQFLPLLDIGIPFEVWFLRILGKVGVKWVYTVHNVLPHENGSRRRLRYEALYRGASHLICHDNAAKKELAGSFGVAPDKVSVIPHGPLFAGRRLDRFEARRRLNLCQDAPVVLWQGILRRYKGVSLLLNAWKQLADDGQVGKAKLVIAGPAETELASEVHGEVDRLQLTDSVYVRFGFAGVDDLPVFYSAADILVYPYHAVTTSGAMMTGLQFGAAIVATRLPPFEELLNDGDNAILFTPGNVAELAAALALLLSDAELRARLGVRSLERGNHLIDWSEIAERTIACYRSVLGSGANTPASERRSYDDVHQQQEVI